MTEREWLAAADPRPMLESLGGRAGGRRLRLFACGCCRRTWYLMTDARSRAAVEAAEAYVDGAATRDELAAAAATARDFAFPWDAYPDAKNAGTAARHAAETGSDYAYYAALFADLALKGVGRGGAAGAERRAQCDLLRCVIGNPFRPVRPDPAWQTPNAVTLARTIYDDRQWELLPLLADLLEGVGCPKEVSDHCRGSGPHARGCWVVDLVLGKS